MAPPGAEPEIAKNFFESTGGDAWTTSPDELARFQVAEAVKWGKVIKAGGPRRSDGPRHAENPGSFKVKPISMFDFETLELDPDAARQYIDARSVFLALEKAVAAALQVRGGMVWVTAKGNHRIRRIQAVDGGSA